MKLIDTFGNEIECTPAEYAEMVRSMTNPGEVTTIKKGDAYDYEALKESLPDHLRETLYVMEQYPQGVHVDTVTEMLELKGKTTASARLGTLRKAGIQMRNVRQGVWRLA